MREGAGDCWSQQSSTRRDGAGGGVLSAFSVEKLNVMAKARAKKLLAMLRGPCQLPLVSLARE